jgi:4-hydroxybutyrate CoA-transferase
VIQEGDLVGLSILLPGVLTGAFHKRALELNRVDIRFLAPREAQLFGGEAPRGEKEIELFIGDGIRPAHDAKVATYLPNTFMLGLKAFDAGREEARIPDVFLTSVSPPDEDGYVHFGPHMWNKKGTQSEQSTPCGGRPEHRACLRGRLIHVSEIEAFVEGAIRPVDRAAVRNRVETLSPRSTGRPCLGSDRRATTRSRSWRTSSTRCRPAS